MIAWRLLYYDTRCFLINNNNPLNYSLIGLFGEKIERDNDKLMNNNPNLIT